MKKLLVFMFIGGLIFGVMEIWNWLRYRNPVEVVLTSNAISELPKHVLLRNIYLSPADIVTTGGLGGKELYIPIRSMGDKSPTTTLHFVLKTKDPVLLAAIEKANSGKSFGDVIRALNPMVIKHEVSGMVDDSSLTSKQRAKLRAEFPKLAEDFSLIEEGRHPSLFNVLLLFGMSAGAFLLISKIYSDPAPAPPPPAPPVANTPR